MQNQVQNWQNGNIPGLYNPEFLESWEKKPLYSMAKWINGKAFKNSDFTNTGLPIIKIAEIKNGISSQTNFTNKKFDQDIFVKPGDILFSWSGTPETSIDIFIWNGFEGWLNQHTFRVEPENEVDKDFFYYTLKYLKKNFIAIASNKKTTGLGHVTIHDLKNISVGIPEKEEQNKIVSILSSFDGKIEVNNKIAKNLEEMAQTIFMEWFVNKTNSSWEITNLGQMLKLYHGFAFKSEQFTTNKTTNIVVRMGNFQEGGGLQFSDNTFYLDDTTGYEKYFLKPEDMVMIFSDITREGRLIGNVGLIPNDSNVYILNQRVAKIDCEPIYKYFFLLLFNSKKFHQHCLSRADSATVLNLKNEHIYDYQVAKPDKDILMKLNIQIAPIFKKLESLTEENQKLSSLRDLLLPKLMKGEIRV